MALTVLLRGGGDLASGVALRLHRCGARVIITELAQPKAVRRFVSFAQAVYDGEITIEGVRAVRVDNQQDALSMLAQDSGIPVIVDPPAAIRKLLAPHVLVDGRMLKLAPDLALGSASLVVGLGPGFIAGVNCDAVIETKRGPFLGRVCWQGSAEPDSGRPDPVGDHRDDRVLRAPVKGKLVAGAQIGDQIKTGQVIAHVESVPILAPFQGRLRGLMMAGLEVQQGEKVGDLDPRDNPRLCWLVSDKALAVGGGVLEAVLSQPGLRELLSG